MGMAANWTRPDNEPEPEPEVVDEPVADVEAATVTDIARYRSVRPVDAEPVHYVPEPDTSLTDDQIRAIYAARREALDGNAVDDFTLQRETRIMGHGGGSKSKIKEQVKPLTPQERMDKFIAATRRLEGGDFEPETEEQRAERLIREERKRIAQAEKRRGRPRKGSEALETVGVRVTPATKAYLRNIDLGTLLDKMVAGILSDPEAVAVLTQAKASAKLAA